MIFIAEPFRELFETIGFTPRMIFADPAIKPWRILEDRQNCTWDLPLSSKPIRLHVKRFPKLPGKPPAELEADGYRLLSDCGIPTASVATWGILEDGRSFIATQDLEGFSPADKLLESGLSFDRLLAPTAEIAARLHTAGLHHRDLYLCHFLARNSPVAPDLYLADLHLIDAARVRRLPGPLIRRRWIIKDLAQFWYSTLPLNITDSQRDDWLRKYTGQADIPESLKKSILSKSTAIRAHDDKLRRREPHRNISIPKM